MSDVKKLSQYADAILMSHDFCRWYLYGLNMQLQDRLMVQLLYIS